jgi:hypothetical protein
VPDREPAAAPSDPASRVRRRSWIGLGFALAALLSCWNPLSAPFGLIVGVAAAILSLRALRASRPRRGVPLTGLGIGALAAVASGVVLALTAGAVGVELPGEPVVKGRTQVELDKVLGEAAERTRERRERALRELGALERSPSSATRPPAAGSPPSPLPGRDGGTP